MGKINEDRYALDWLQSFSEGRRLLDSKSKTVFPKLRKLGFWKTLNFKSVDNAIVDLQGKLDSVNPPDHEKLSLFSLAEKALASDTAKDVQGRSISSDRYKVRYRVEFGAAGNLLLLTLGNKAFSVWAVHFVDVVDEIQQPLTPTPLAYEQRNINGVLGWVLFGKGTYNGQTFYTRQPFIRQSDGTALLGPPAISAISGISMLSFHTQLIYPNPRERKPGG